MKPHRILAVFERHLLETRRNLDRITDLFYWPLIDVVTWGFFSGYLAVSGDVSRMRAEFLVLAAVFWSFFRSIQRDVAIGILSEIWARNLTSMLTTPLTLGEYVTGLATLGAAKALVGTLVVLVLAKAVYISFSLTQLADTAIFVVVLALFGFAIGLLITGVIIRYSTSVQSVAWSITGLLLPVSCVFYPAAALPAAVRWVAWLMPTTQSFEGMRQIVSGGTFPWPRLVEGALLAFAYAILCLILFGRLLRRARELGLLVKPE